MFFDFSKKKFPSLFIIAFYLAYLSALMFKYYMQFTDNTEVMMKLGQALADSGQIQDGMKFTQLAIDKDPHFLIAHLNKAKMHIQVG